jgi:N-methylhydantoinase A/oxoprolinase/acetone carboxylase beta subunit
MPGCRPRTGERDNVSELINVEVSVYGRLPRIDVPDDAPVGERHPEPSSPRDAFFSEYGECGPTAVYDAAQLRVDDVINRPAIVEEESTTIVVFPAGR